MATKPIRAYLINGIAHSFASASIEISCPATGKSIDLQNVGLTAINYKIERDLGEPLRGGHPDPIAYSRGQNKYTGSMKMSKAVRDYIVTEVLGGPGYADRIYDVKVSWLEAGLDTTVDEIQRCRWASGGSDNQKGTDITEIEVNMFPTKILLNGQDDVDNPLVNVAA